jgi:hypothetical protein
MEHNGWEVAFRGGPLNDQTKQMDAEPGEEIELAPDEGGPYTYLRVASVLPDAPTEPIRLVYHPEPSMESQEANRERTMSEAPINHDMPGIERGDVDQGFDHQFRGAR